MGLTEIFKFATFSYIFDYYKRHSQAACVFDPKFSVTKQIKTLTRVDSITAIQRLVT